LNVYNAQTGELLKEIQTGTAIMAAPMTYMVEGIQYVSVMAGYGGGLLAFGPTDPKVIFHQYENYGRILTFRLGGGETPMPPKKNEQKVPEPPDFEEDPELVVRGKSLFGTYCGHCHMAGESKSRYSHYPNLAKMSESTHSIFNEIVLEGAFANIGMDSFEDVLDEEGTEAIHHYLIHKQKELYSSDK
jgi:quinohemoprotein ethanol dehydrogenase